MARPKREVPRTAIMCRVEPDELAKIDAHRGGFDRARFLIRAGLAYIEDFGAVRVATPEDDE